MTRTKKILTCGDYQKMSFQFPLEDGIKKLYYHYVSHTNECNECSNWELSKRIIERGGNPSNYCCLMMGEKLTYICDLHPDPWTCPDHIVIKTKEGHYGILIRDGGNNYSNNYSSSYISINYCPWCGSRI